MPLGPRIRAAAGEVLGAESVKLLESLMKGKPTILYGGMTLFVATITPRIAAVMLEMNSSNRRLRPGFVARYSREMTASRWVPKPLALCFTADGKVGNGQHTLSALVDSGTSHDFLIAINVSAETIAIMDVGLTRTMKDVANFLGQSYESIKGASARVVAFGVSDNTSRSFDEVFGAYTEHKEVIDAAFDMIPGGYNKKNSVFMAVCARALYTRPSDRVKRFVEVVVTGVADGARESAAIRLRDALQGKQYVGETNRRVLYQKCESALDAFTREVPLTKLYGTEKELFPTPQ